MRRSVFVIAAIFFALAVVRFASAQCATGCYNYTQWNVNGMDFVSMDDVCINYATQVNSPVCIKLQNTGATCGGSGQHMVAPMTQCRCCNIGILDVRGQNYQLSDDCTGKGPFKKMELTDKCAAY